MCYISGLPLDLTEMIVVIRNKIIGVLGTAANANLFALYAVTYLVKEGIVILKIQKDSLHLFIL